VFKLVLNTHTHTRTHTHTHENMPFNRNYTGMGIERTIWREMKKDLAEHNSFATRQKYHTRRDMTGWEKDARDIEGRARAKIAEIQRPYLEKKKAIARSKREEEKAAKEAKSLNEMLSAAETLMMLKYPQTCTKQEIRKTKAPVAPSRKSSRIMEKVAEEIRRNCPGCHPQMMNNQLAHMGPGGCIGDDDYM